MSQDHSFQVLTKCRITINTNQFMLLLNDMKRKLLACFYPLKVLCTTSSVGTINWFFFILLLFFLIAYQCHLFGLFSKMKESMNINRCIILVSKMCYDKIQFDDYGQLCTSLPNYWPWSLGKVSFTWFCISDRLLGCQEQPLLERYAWNLNMFASLSFVNTICLWKPHVFMWQNLEENGPMTCFTKIHISLWLLGQIRWGLHWIVEK